ncbi:hypothetical protein [Streptomyces cellostaticus]|nr:hypothetical protein [Streptomyces cellostaticus]
MLERTLAFFALPLAVGAWLVGKDADGHSRNCAGPPSASPTP